MNLKTGLLAYYRFEGNTLNSYGPAPALPAGGTFAAGGLIGQCKTTWATQSSGWNPVAGMTWSWSWWFKVPTGSANGVGCDVDLFDSATATVVETAYVGAGTSGQLQIDGGLVGPALTHDGSWHHIVVVSDGASRKVYLDVAEVMSVTVTPHNLGDIGAFLTGDFNCPIDEMGVWGVALTPPQVSALYNGGAGLDPTGVGTVVGTVTITVTITGTINLSPLVTGTLLGLSVDE